MAASLFSAADPDGQTILQYQFFDGTVGAGRFSRDGTVLPEFRNFSIDAADLDSLVFTPSASGSDEIWIQAFDGTAWSAWQIVTVGPAPNTKPVVAVADLRPAKGTTSIAGAGLFSVSDGDGDTITRYRFFDGTTGNGRFTLGGVDQSELVNIEITAAQLGTFAYRTSGTDVGDTLWVQAFDGYEWGDWKSFDVAAPQNAAPVVAAGEFAPARGVASVAASALFTVSDADGDAITRYKFFDGTIGNGRFLLNGAPQAENVNVEITAAQLLSFTYQVSATGAGDTLWVQAYDGTAWSAWKSFSAQAPVNAAPAVAVSDRTPPRGSATLQASTLFTASDADGDAITRYRFFDGTIGNGRFLLSGAAQAENANIEITAAQLSAFTYQVSATGSGDTLWVQASDGIAWGQWKSFAVSAPGNAAPVVTVRDIAPAAGTSFIAVGNLFTVADADGDSITQYRLFDGTAGNGYISVNGAAQLSGRNITIAAATLAATRFVTSTDGSDDFWVQAFDGLEWSEWRNFTIDAAPAAPAGPAIAAPFARADVGRTNEDTALTVAVLANDDNGGSSALRVSSVTQGAHGSVSINGDGSIRYSPTANYSGTDSFSYTIANEAGSSSGSVTIAIDPVNDAPVARNDSGFTTLRNAPRTFTAQSLLANDSDADGDALSISAAGNASGGSVALVSGSIVFTPAANFSGSASFSYTVSDGHGGQATASVALTVLPNSAPVATDDRNVGSGPRTIYVLGNDRDADGDVLRVASFTQAQHGTLTLNANGTFTYVPNAGYLGTDSFTYVLSDGSVTDSASVSIQVTAPAANFRQKLTDAAEGSWVTLNINQFSDVWTPAALRAGTGSPLSVINAWGSMAWDSNRGDLIFWGGGHANYGGNEVYVWHSSTLSWERASLPSQIVNVSGSQARYEAIDGVLNAPISSHTYDNNEFLPIADRFLVWGGAAYNTGSQFVDSSGQPTGPYFWDPSKADGNKVGGTTGSGVDPTTVGGDMWENRDNLPSGQRPGDGLFGFLGGTTAYATENGKDVIYISEGELWKYTVNDVNNPALDTYEKVGNDFNAYNQVQGAGAVDINRRIFLRTTGDGKFAFWDLSQAGPNNRDQLFIPTDPTGQFQFNKLASYGMDFDSTRGNFVLWNGGAEVWILTPPSTLSTSGWTLTRASLPGGGPVPTTLGAGTTTATGVLGKWKYIAEQDIFLGVIDYQQGTVWAYKPGDWQPDNSLPTVAITDLSGMSAAPGTAVNAKAFVSWSDADGDHVTFSFTDQIASASSGHFRLNGVDQAANTAISVTDTQLQAGALLWVAGNAGSQDQIRVTAADPFGQSGAVSFMTPAAMAGLIAQAPASLVGAPSGTDTSLLQSNDDQKIYLAGNSA